MNNLNYLRCPCKKLKKLKKLNNKLFCTDLSCSYFKKEFKIKNGIPILINFKMPKVIFDQKDIHFKKITKISNYKNIFLNYIFKESEKTIENINLFLKKISFKKKANILVVGGATQGQGTQKLWTNKKIQIISIDISGSLNTDYIADAHYLPFKSNYFDGVFIQAVLEHVVSPETVVNEIYRVLKFNGIVYAETPFMQQIHMGKDDYTRYTVSGHRYLFRFFKNIKCGVNGGPGTVLAWSLKYFFWSIFGKKISNYLSIIFFMIFANFDKIISNKKSWDSASGVFFLGKKDKKYRFKVRELNKYYHGLQ